MPPTIAYGARSIGVKPDGGNTKTRYGPRTWHNACAGRSAFCGKFAAAHYKVGRVDNQTIGDHPSLNDPQDASRFGPQSDNVARR